MHIADVARMFSVCALLAAALCVVDVSARIVNTQYGPVSGNTVQLDDGKLIDSFWGIPYARPPLGELRFENPQPPQAWDGVFPATELPNQCMQGVAGLIWMTHPGWAKYSEDCLNLNIFTPADMGEAPYAVMVWFHGGGYQGGGNVQYPGHFLAAQGVIVVTVNYRLGAFGFTNTPDGTLKGNQALWDQRLALEFVRDNIANFGGDPSRITIFGQSAGASSSSLQMVSPVNRGQGLFHQAIMESGTEQTLWALNYPGSNPEQYVYQLANKTNCLAATDAEMVACLKSRPAIVIRANQDLVCTPGWFCQGFSPIVDGPDGFLPGLPLDIKDPEYSIPIISGICKDDGSLYTEFFIPEAHDGGFNSTMFDFYLRTRLIDIFGPQLTEEQYENVFQAMRFNYINWPYIDDLEANRDAFNWIVTDAAFAYPWDRQLKQQSEYGKDSYGYIMAFRSLNATSYMPEWMGVPHMGELPYVWGYAKLLKNPAVRVDCGINFDIVGWTPEDIAYADYQMPLWANFAKYGNPTPEPVKSPFNDTFNTWEKFSWDDNLKSIWLGAEIEERANYRQQDYAFFYEYIAYITGKPIKSAAGEKPRRRESEFQFESSILSDGFERMVRRAWEERGLDVDSFDTVDQ